MSETGSTAAPAQDKDAAHLESLGYKQELSRVLGFFDNFSVAFTYLSPVVGIYSLVRAGHRYGRAALHLARGADRVIGMLFVAMVFGELALALPGGRRALPIQQVQRGVRPYGWWVGWIYGIALLSPSPRSTPALWSYVTTLSEQLVGTGASTPTKHSTIFIITIVAVGLSRPTANITGAQHHGPVVARTVMIVETLRHVWYRDHPGDRSASITALGYLFKTEGVQYKAT